MIGRALRRHAVALSYLVALTAGALFTQALPTVARDTWIRWVSTSVANLIDHPVPALVLSAFVARTSLLSWLAVGAVGLVGINRALGNAGALVLITAAQVIGTLVSEGIVAARVLLGQLPDSQWYLVDTGPSFVIFGAVSAAVVYGSWPVRALSAVAFVLLLPHMFGGLQALNVSAVGHLVALVTALVAGAVLPSVNLGSTPGYRWRLRMPARRRGPEVADNPES
jgi:hypothetical protein